MPPRDLKKAEVATALIRNNCATAGGSFELVALDLASLKSVRECADELLAKGQFLDVVIANAGVMATPFGHTADGFETQFGTNHLGHFVLSQPHCAASAQRQQADQPLFRRSPFFQRRPRRSQF